MGLFGGLRAGLLGWAGLKPQNISLSINKGLDVLPLWWVSITNLSRVISKSTGKVSGKEMLLIFSGDPLQKTVKWDSPTPLTTTDMHCRSEVNWNCRIMPISFSKDNWNKTVFFCLKFGLKNGTFLHQEIQQYSSRTEEKMLPPWTWVRCSTTFQHFPSLEDVQLLVQYCQTEKKEKIGVWDNK